MSVINKFKKIPCRVRQQCFTVSIRIIKEYVYLHPDLEFFCHLVLSTRRVLATVLTILLQCFLSAVTSLSSTSFIPVTSYISSIHFLLGCPLLLLPSPYASIILFSSPSDRITCPKNPSFLLSTVCCSVPSSSIPISLRTLSLVFFSVHDILCIFLHIHILHVSQPYRTVGKISILTIHFVCLCSHVCLTITFLIQSL